LAALYIIIFLSRICFSLRRERERLFKRVIFGAQFSLQLFKRKQTYVNICHYLTSLLCLTPWDVCRRWSGHGKDFIEQTIGIGKNSAHAYLLKDITERFTEL